MRAANARLLCTHPNKVTVHCNCSRQHRQCQCSSSVGCQGAKPGLPTPIRQLIRYYEATRVLMRCLRKQICMSRCVVAGLNTVQTAVTVCIVFRLQAYREWDQVQLLSARFTNSAAHSPCPVRLPSTPTPPLLLGGDSDSCLSHRLCQSHGGRVWRLLLVSCRTLPSP